MAEHDDVGDFSEDLGYGHVTFVVAKRPTDRLDVSFEKFEVDGADVDLGPPGSVPGDQGFWIDVGGFPVGVEIEVRWQVHTGIDVPDGEIIFGHCPNGKLKKLVRLEQRTVEPFETYVGTFKVTPERP